MSPIRREEVPYPSIKMGGKDLLKLQPSLTPILAHKGTYDFYCPYLSTSVESTINGWEYLGTGKGQRTTAQIDWLVKEETTAQLAWRSRCYGISILIDVLSFTKPCFFCSENISCEPCEGKHFCSMWHLSPPFWRRLYLWNVIWWNQIELLLNK